MPFGLQPIHLIAIAIVALVIFGPKRLPEIGRGLGKALNEFRTGTREMTESFREEVHTQDPTPAGPVVAQSTAEPQPQPQIPYQPQPMSPQQNANFCTQCGSPNPVGARFCNKCGSQMPA